MGGSKEAGGGGGGVPCMHSAVDNAALTMTQSSQTVANQKPSFVHPFEGIFLKGYAHRKQFGGGKKHTVMQTDAFLSCCPVTATAIRCHHQRRGQVHQTKGTRNHHAATWCKLLCAHCGGLQRLGWAVCTGRTMTQSSQTVAHKQPETS